MNPGHFLVVIKQHVDRAIGLADAAESPSKSKEFQRDENGPIYGVERLETDMKYPSG